MAAELGTNVLSDPVYRSCFDALQTGTRRQEQRATYVGQLTDGG